MRLIKISVVLVLLSLPACSCTFRDSSPDVSADRVLRAAESVLSGFEAGVTHTGENLAESDLAELFGGTDAPRVREYSVFTSVECEAGVLRLYQESDSPTVRQACMDRLDRLRTAGIIGSEGEVRAYGKYVYYAIASDTDSVFAALEKVLIAPKNK